MNFDPGMINQMLNMIPYPVGKSQLVQMAQQFGANEQVLGLIDRLPDKTFNNAQELQEAIGGLGNLGDLGNMGGLGGFKL